MYDSTDLPSQNFIETATCCQKAEYKLIQQLLAKKLHGNYTKILCS